MGDEPRRATSALRRGVGFGAFVAACAVWLYGAVHSPVLDADLARQKAFADHILNRQPTAPAVPAEAPPAAPSTETDLADAYWRRNPGVAGHHRFGRQGELGVGGARLHYDLHGRFEGRRWGLAD